MIRHILVAGALFGLTAMTPALADTAGPTNAEINAAMQIQAASPISDSELRNFAQAQREVMAIYPHSPVVGADLARVRLQTEAALERHHLTATRYNEIDLALDANPAIARRYAAITTSYASGG